MTEHPDLSQRLTGQMTALITPYTASGTVDVPGFHRHVQFQIERRVEVLAAAGTIGDSPFLTMDERLTLVRALADGVGRQGVAIAGVPSDRPQEAVEATAAAGDAGADAVLVMAPPLLKLTPEEQWGFWRWFDEHTNLPFIVYSTPHAASGRVTRELAERLGGLRHIVAIKDAFPDVDGLRQLAATAAGLPVIAAAEKILPGAIEAGVAGFMTASSCFAPELMWHLWLAVREGDQATQDDAFGCVLSYRSIFQDSMDCGFPSFMPTTRAACAARNLPTGASRFPLTDVGPDVRVAIAERVDAMTAAPFDSLPPAF